MIIKKKGVKVRGIIDSYFLKEKILFENKMITKHLRIRYINPKNGLEEIYETPQINFNPFYQLGNKYCSVYLYKDKIYVSDFVEKSKHQANIWGKDDVYEEVIKTNK